MRRFCSLVAASLAAAFIGAAPAQAQLLTSLNQVRTFEDYGQITAGSGPSATAEVGDFTESDGPGEVGNRIDIWGVVDVYAGYDNLPEPAGSLYLTFDVFKQGGSYPPEYGPCCIDFAPGNVDRPFDGQIKLSWFLPAFNGDSGQFALRTTLATFSVSPATTGVGSTFSFAIGSAFDTALPEVEYAEDIIGFSLNAVTPPHNTAWTFNNFRLTRTDATQLVSPGGGVPEPATWALMLAGFFSVGAMLRRQQRLGRALA